MKGSCDGWYWSSSPVEDSGNYAWFVAFKDALVGSYSKDDFIIVRCVR